MPKCLVNSVFHKKQSYERIKTVFNDDPNVMMTRSGLSIRKIPSFSFQVQPYTTTVSTVHSTPIQSLRDISSTGKSQNSSLSIVTRYELLQYNVEIESANLNYTNSPLVFLATAQDYCSSTMCTRHNHKVVPLSPPSPQPCDSPTQPKPSFKKQPTISSPMKQYPVIAALQAPLKIDLSSSDSTGSSPTNDHVSTSMVKVSPKQPREQSSKTSQHLLELIETQGVIDVQNADNVELKEKLEPFIMIVPNGRMPQNLYKCSICKRVYGDIKAFGYHINSHLKLKNKCHICGRIFTRNWLLKGHLRVHTGEKPFHCETCGKAFADKSNLRSHILIHTVTTKAHICPKCNKSFAQRRYLHKHLLEVCK